MQKWDDEEVSRRSKISNWWPQSQICSNPKGRKWMCRPSSKSCLNRIYACLRTGIIIRSTLLTYRWRKVYVGSRLWMQLDYAIDILSENRRVIGREERRKKVKGPGITVCANERCVIEKRFLTTIPVVSRPRGSTLRNERSPRGICGNHSGARSLVHKLVRAGYYWPTMLKDVQAYVKSYDKHQRFSNFIRQPSKELTPMTAP